MIAIDRLYHSPGLLLELGEHDCRPRIYGACHGEQILICMASGYDVDAIKGGTFRCSPECAEGQL